MDVSEPTNLETVKALWAQKRSGKARPGRSATMLSNKLTSFSSRNLDNPTPREAAMFWSKALSWLAQLGGQSGEEFLLWKADRVLAIIEDDGDANSEHLLTRPEIILVFRA